MSASRNTRLGFLIPPGNPTTEPEVIRLAPTGTTVHFTRMLAGGAAGSARRPGGAQPPARSSTWKRMRRATWRLVKPAVIVMAHTATSYTLGQRRGAGWWKRLESGHRGLPVHHRLRQRAPRRSEQLKAKAEWRWRRRTAANRTLPGKAHLEARGIEVESAGDTLDDVSNIYDETPERAYELAKRVDVPEAQAVFLSGVGMPTDRRLEEVQERAWGSR